MRNIRIFFKTILEILSHIYSPLIVPIALLFAKKTNEENKVYIQNNHLYPKQMRKLPKFFNFVITPDDILIPSGLYEPTVYNIYKKYGWFISQWYWWGFRNCGHWIMWSEGYEAKNANYKFKVIGPFKFIWGEKLVQDWYELKFKYIYPTRPRLVCVPRVSVRIKEKDL